MFGGAKTPPPPPPPPPPPSPPTYASAAAVAPRTQVPRYGALSDSILTGPLGAVTPGTTARKSLLGE